MNESTVGVSAKGWTLAAFLLAFLAPAIGVVVLMFMTVGLGIPPLMIARNETLIFLCAWGTASLLAAAAAWNAARKRVRRTESAKEGLDPSIIGLLVGAASLVWSYLGFLNFTRMFAHGRRFRVRGEEHLAQTEDGPGWSEELESVEGLSIQHRAVLAEGWEQNARAEHASIAAFSRLSLQLMALGAPSHLLELAQQAGLDEVRHAKDAFSQASVYAGRPIQPAPFPEALFPERGDLSDASLAVESLIDGCIGESLAAKTLQQASTRVSDPSLRQMLLRTAMEEAQHASFAWEIVAWCAQRGALGTEAALRAAIPDCNAFTASEIAAPTSGNRSASLCATMGRLLPAEETALRHAVNEECRSMVAAILH